MSQYSKVTETGNVGSSVFFYSTCTTFFSGISSLFLTWNYVRRVQGPINPPPPPPWIVTYNMNCPHCKMFYLFYPFFSPLDCMATTILLSSKVVQIYHLALLSLNPWYTLQYLYYLQTLKTACSGVTKDIITKLLKTPNLSSIIFVQYGSNLHRSLKTLSCNKSFLFRLKGFSHRTKLDQVINLKNVDVIKVPNWSLDLSKSEEKIFMSIFSLSAPKNFDDRQNLRREIESFRSDFVSNNLGSIHLTFLLGLTPDKDVKERIGIESDRFGDILQLSVEDSYQNLSYKTLGAYQWIHSVVSQIFVVKIFLNKLEHLSHLVISGQVTGEFRLAWLVCGYHYNKMTLDKKEDSNLKQLY